MDSVSTIYKKKNKLRDDMRKREYFEIGTLYYSLSYVCYCSSRILTFAVFVILVMLFRRRFRFTFHVLRVFTI